VTLSIPAFYLRDPPYSKGGMLYVVRTFLSGFNTRAIERPANANVILNYELWLNKREGVSNKLLATRWG